PEFHADAFPEMSDEEARRVEWRALEAADPETARRAPRDWDRESFACLVVPDWLGAFVLVVPEDSVEDSAATAARERPARQVPVEGSASQGERMVARDSSEGRTAQP